MVLEKNLPLTSKHMLAKQDIFLKEPIINNSCLVPNPSSLHLPRDLLAGQFKEKAIQILLNRDLYTNS